MNQEVFKILGLCIIGSVIAIALKGKAPEHGWLLSLGCGAVAVVLVINKLSAPISQISRQLEASGTGIEFFQIALKSVGIGYVCSFVADACRECGQTLLASTAETAGKCAILYLSLPLIISVGETAVGFIT